MKLIVSIFSWIGLSIFIGYLAKKRGHESGFFIIISLLFSPVFGAIILFALPDISKKKSKEGKIVNFEKLRKMHNEESSNEIINGKGMESLVKPWIKLNELSDVKIGKVLCYNGNDGTGKVILSDGEKLDFSIDNWADPNHIPETGMDVKLTYKENTAGLGSKHTFQIVKKQDATVLFQCPECSQDISRSAKTCPHCGVLLQMNSAETKETQKTKQKAWHEDMGCFSTLLFFLILFSIAGGLGYGLFRCEKGLKSLTESSSSKPKTSTKRNYSQSTESLEYQLAVIDNKGYVSKDDTRVVRFRYLLSELDKKCSNSQQDIANATVMAQKILREKYGKEVGLLSLMEGVHQSIPDGSPTLDYAETITLYIQYLK